jgi:hypothetical protein
MAGAILEPRRADARRSWWRYSPNANRTDLQVRFSNYSGLTGAALDRMCVCVSQKSFFAGKRSHCNRRRRRKAPVGCITEANSKRRNSSHCNCRRGLQTHGGLTDAAPGAACDGRVGMCAELSSQVRFTNHGALTPAALDRMCVCVSQNRFFCRQTCAPRNKSGGRKPPWGAVRVRTHRPRRTPGEGAEGVRPPWGAFDVNSKRRNSSHCNCKRGLQTHGGLTPAAPGAACDGRVWMCPELSSQVRFSNHGGLTGAAPGAVCDGRVWMCPELSSQARFSNHGGLTPAAPDRMCVCVSQKSFFAGKHSYCNKSGGRKPPVGWIRRANSSVSEHSR